MERSASDAIIETNLRVPPTYLIVRGTEAVAPRTIDRNKSNLGRSQTVHNSHNVVLLTPKRHDRIRMEHRLSDVWTRNVIPYPGMQTGRSEFAFRSSAGSLLRKLSLHRPFTSRRSVTSTASSREKSSKPVNFSENQILDEKHGIEPIVTPPDTNIDVKKPSGHETPRRADSVWLKLGSTSLAPKEDSQARKRKPGLRKKLSMSIFRPPSRRSVQAEE
ncbi:hypothetical protein VTO42DRAFT_234 [Malbranchea cinnamomea]